MILEKKALANWKMKHDLHVLLIMTQENCTKAVAQAQAYHEGLTGLTARQKPAEAPTPPAKA